MKKYLFHVAVLIVLATALTYPLPSSSDTSVDERTPISFPVYDHCADEFLQVTAEYHRVITTKLKRNGMIEVRTHFTSHGEAVGLTSGNRYIFNDKFNQTNENLSACGFTLSLVRTQRLISQGSYPNRTLKLTLTVTQDSSCDVETKTSESIECRN